MYATIASIFIGRIPEGIKTRTFALWREQSKSLATPKPTRAKVLKTKDGDQQTKTFLDVQVMSDWLLLEV